jgi:hypothetical protein
MSGEVPLADATGVHALSPPALLQENGCLVLRFLAEDLGKQLDTTLDVILRAGVHRRRNCR